MTLEVKHVSYKVQSQVEVWRAKRSTFNVMHPTHDTAEIMGLRGSFQREINEKLQTKEHFLTTPYPSVIANTFERKE